MKRVVQTVRMMPKARTTLTVTQGRPRAVRSMSRATTNFRVTVIQTPRGTVLRMVSPSLELAPIVDRLPKTMLPKVPMLRALDRALQLEMIWMNPGQQNRVTQDWMISERLALPGPVRERLVFQHLTLSQNLRVRPIVDVPLPPPSPMDRFPKEGTALRLKAWKGKTTRP